MVASAIFITDLNGNPLIQRNYRGDIPSSITNEFKRILVQNDDTASKPILLNRNSTFCFVEHNDVYLVAVTKVNANVMLIFNFLYKIIEVFNDYFNGLEQEAICDNFVLIYELLDEMSDFGYPQYTDTKTLKDYICVKEKHKLDITDICVKERLKLKAKEVSTSITGNVPWRKSGIKHNMGWSTGGAKDINNFRDCINNQILPKISSITYNGIFYDYYFQNMNEKEMKNQCLCKEQEGMNNLFYPSYCYAKCNDNYYISVGLNSNLTSDQFKRNKLNVMIILDISGSMNQSFDIHNDMIDDGITKIDIAKQCLIDVISTHIHNDDTFSILLFNSDVNILQPFELFKHINKNELIQKIKNIKAAGGTNLGNAYQTATVLFDSLKGMNKNNSYDNRILYLTDAKSDLCYNECKQLIDLSKLYGSKSLKDGRISTTFIGIGIDFNTDLVNKITSELYGANYYSVHCVKDFKKQMLDEFDLMVSPLIFNLKMEIIHEGNNNNYYIHEIYGNGNENNNGNGELMHVKTLFPSRCNENSEVKGGIILIKICPGTLRDESKLNMELKVSYEDRYGQTFENKQKILFEIDNTRKIYFDNNGIRKAVLLVKYVKLLQEWIIANNSFFISKLYRTIFQKFMKHFQHEMKIINDNTLTKEIKILNKLIETSNDYYQFDRLSLYRNQEIFLLVTEKINVVINNRNSYNNKIFLAECNGTIMMNSHLSGMPEIKIGVNLGNKRKQKHLAVRSRRKMYTMNEELRFHQCVRLSRIETDNVISFIPPDGKFELLSYKIDDSNNIRIPFNMIHNIKYELDSIDFDIILEPKFDSHLMAKDIIVRIPIGAPSEFVTKNEVKCEYGKVELENEYLIWNVKSLYNERKPRLYGRLYLHNNSGWDMRCNEYNKQLSEISVQFSMDHCISSCVKIMYLKVVEKSGYKAFKRIEYKTETDSVHNIKFKM